MEDDPITRRREQRRRQSAARAMAVVIALAGACVVAIVIAVVVKGRQGGGGEGTGKGGEATAAGSADVEKWTYKEMAAHLEKNGLKGWEYRSHKDGAVMLSPDRAARAAGSLSRLDATLEHGVTWPDGIVMFEKARDAEAARQTAGRTTRPVIAYRNWLVWGEAPVLDQLRPSLR